MTSPSTVRVAAEHVKTHRLAAFGLNIESELPLPGSSLGATAGLGPATTVRLVSAEQVEAAWAQSAERVFEPRYSDGETYFTVEQSKDHYLLWFKGYGRYLVRADGTGVACERGRVSRARHQRFIFAQALPLAAALQGLELLHAGAVRAGDGVAAFVGPSGVGKTSLVSNLVQRGACFVSDDVLALEREPGGLVAHPGPPFIAVRQEDRALLNVVSSLGPTVGSSEKSHFSVATVDTGMPLRSLYHLEPGPSVEITPLEGDIRRILSSVFAPYLVTHDRLQRHLDVARLLSGSVAQFRLRVPRTRGYDAVLEAVEAHLSDPAS